MWVKTHASTPLDHEIKAVEVEELELLIGNIDGVLFCTDNRCPHEDAKLTLGCIENGRLKCSLHGYNFDIKSGKSNDDDVCSLRIYPIKQKDNAIYIDI